MATSKLANIQDALNQTRPTTATIRETRAEAPAMAPVAGQRQANRQGKVNLAAWLHPDFKASMRLVQARRPGSIQELMEEALNDLFAKYDVPQVSPGPTE
jgi:Antitoxin-like ribbon-helix-helix